MLSKVNGDLNHETKFKEAPEESFESRVLRSKMSRNGDAGSGEFSFRFFFFQIFLIILNTSHIISELFDSNFLFVSKFYFKFYIMIKSNKLQFMHQSIFPVLTNHVFSIILYY